MFRLLKQLVERLRRWSPPEPGPPYDPYAGVREPKRTGPGNRDLAVALREPEPPQRVDAVGRLPR
jgi:hypothetical protein